MAIPEEIIEKFFTVFYDRTMFTSKTMRSDISAALEAAGVGELIEALAGANTILGWFADERNWRMETLSEGRVFSAEWKIGLDPMELARQAKAKSDAALIKIGDAP